MTYTGDGTTSSFAVPFLFVDRYDVMVFVNGVQTTTFSWSSTGAVTLPSAPAVGVVVQIMRHSVADTSTINFTGGIPRPADLTAAFRKVLYIAQEALGWAKSAMQQSFNGIWDAVGLRIQNVADPVSPKDAVNLETLQGSVNSEASTRMSADAGLQSGINAEAASRMLADAGLQAGINAEAAARTAAIVAATNPLMAIQGSTWEARGLRVVDAADPVNAGDLVTLEFLQSYIAAVSWPSQSSVLTLPTSLPATSGQLWNNGGVLSVS